MDVGSERCCYIDRWERTIGVDGSDVCRKHTIVRKDRRSVTLSYEQVDEFCTSCHGECVKDFRYTDRWEHTVTHDDNVDGDETRPTLIFRRRTSPLEFAMDSQTSTESPNNNPLMKSHNDPEEDRGLLDGPRDVSDIAGRRIRGADVTRKGDIGGDAVGDGKTTFEPHNVSGLDLRRTSEHYTDRWERTERVDTFHISRHIVVSKVFHPLRSSVAINGVPYIHGNDNVIHNLEDEVEEDDNDGIHKIDVRDQVSVTPLQKVRIVKVNQAGVSDVEDGHSSYSTSTSSLDLNPEKREQPLVSAVDIILDKTINSDDKPNSTGDAGQTIVAGQTISGQTIAGNEVCNVSSLDSSETITIRYTDRWERTEGVDESAFNNRHILVSKLLPPCESLRAGVSSTSCRDNSVLKLQYTDTTVCCGGIERKNEGSLSTDDPSSTNPVSSTFQEKSKMVEVDQNDTPSLEAKHVSVLCFTVGVQPEKENQLIVSEMSTNLPKTIGTDVATSPREDQMHFISELQFNLSSSFSPDDSIDYWSADMSSDITATSDSIEKYVETGDAMYTSDSNDSLLELSDVFLHATDSLMKPILTTLWKDGSDQTEEIARVSYKHIVDTHKESVVSELVSQQNKACERKSDNTVSQQYSSQFDLTQYMNPDEKDLQVDRETLNVSKDIVNLHECDTETLWNVDIVNLDQDDESRDSLRKSQNLSFQTDSQSETITKHSNGSLYHGGNYDDKKTADLEVESLEPPARTSPHDGADYLLSSYAASVIRTDQTRLTSADAQNDETVFSMSGFSNISHLEDGLQLIDAVENREHHEDKEVDNDDDDEVNYCQLTNEGHEEASLNQCESSLNLIISDSHHLQNSQDSSVFLLTEEDRKEKEEQVGVNENDDKLQQTNELWIPLCGTKKGSPQLENIGSSNARTTRDSTLTRVSQPVDDLILYMEAEVVHGNNINVDDKMVSVTDEDTNPGYIHFKHVEKDVQDLPVDSGSKLCERQGDSSLSQLSVSSTISDRVAHFEATDCTGNYSQLNRAVSPTLIRVPEQFVETSGSSTPQIASHLLLPSVNADKNEAIDNIQNDGKPVSEVTSVVDVPRWDLVKDQAVLGDAAVEDDEGFILVTSKRNRKKNMKVRQLEEIVSHDDDQREVTSMSDFRQTAVDFQNDASSQTTYSSGSLSGLTSDERGVIASVEKLADSTQPLDGKLRIHNVVDILKKESDSLGVVMWNTELDEEVVQYVKNTRGHDIKTEEDLAEIHDEEKDGDRNNDQTKENDAERGNVLTYVRCESNEEKDSDRSDDQTREYDDVNGRDDQKREYDDVSRGEYQTREYDDVNRRDDQTREYDDVNRRDDQTREYEDLGRGDDWTKEYYDVDRRDNKSGVNCEEEDTKIVDHLKEYDTADLRDPNENVETDEQENVTTEEQENVETEKQENIMTDKQANVATDKQKNVMTDKQDIIITDDQENLETDKQENVTTDEQENVITDEQENVITDEQENGITNEQENVITDEQENVITDTHDKFQTNIQERALTDKEKPILADDQLREYDNADHRDLKDDDEEDTNQSYNQAIREDGVDEDKTDEAIMLDKINEKVNEDAEIEINKSGDSHQHNVTDIETSTERREKVLMEQSTRDSFLVRTNNTTVLGPNYEPLGIQLYNVKDVEGPVIDGPVQWDTAEVKSQADGREDCLQNRTEVTITVTEMGLSDNDQKLSEGKAIIQKQGEELNNVITDKQENVIPDTQENVVTDEQENVIPDTQENVITDTQENVMPDTQENIMTDTQENIITDTQENVMTDTQENIMTDTKENVIIDKQDNAVTDVQEDAKTDERENLMKYEQENVETDEQENVITDEQENVITDEQENVITDEQENVITDEQENVITDEQENVITNEQEAFRTDQVKMIMKWEEWNVIEDIPEIVITDEHENVLALLDEQENVIANEQGKDQADGQERVLTSEQEPVLTNEHEIVLIDEQENVISNALENVLTDKQEKVQTEYHKSVQTDVQDVKTDEQVNFITDQKETDIADEQETDIADEQETDIANEQETDIADEQENIVAVDQEIASVGEPLTVIIGNQRNGKSDEQKNVTLDEQDNGTPDEQENVTPDEIDIVTKDKQENIIIDENVIKAEQDYFIKKEMEAVKEMIDEAENEDVIDSVKIDSKIQAMDMEGNKFENFDRLIILADVGKDHEVREILCYEVDDESEIFIGKQKTRFGDNELQCSRLGNAEIIDKSDRCILEEHEEQTLEKSRDSKMAQSTFQHTEKLLSVKNFSVEIEQGIYRWQEFFSHEAKDTFMFPRSETSADTMAGHVQDVLEHTELPDTFMFPRSETSADTMAGHVQDVLEHTELPDTFMFPRSETSADTMAGHVQDVLEHTELPDTFMFPRSETSADTMAGHVQDVLEHTELPDTFMFPRSETSADTMAGHVQDVLEHTELPDTFMFPRSETSADTMAGHVQDVLEHTELPDTFMFPRSETSADTMAGHVQDVLEHTELPDTFMFPRSETSADTMAGHVQDVLEHTELPDTFMFPRSETSADTMAGHVQDVLEHTELPDTFMFPRSETSADIMAGHVQDVLEHTELPDTFMFPRSETSADTMAGHVQDVLEHTELPDTFMFPRSETSADTMAGHVQDDLEHTELPDTFMFSRFETSADTMSSHVQDDLEHTKLPDTFMFSRFETSADTMESHVQDDLEHTEQPDTFMFSRFETSTDTMAGHVEDDLELNFPHISTPTYLTPKYVQDNLGSNIKTSDSTDLILGRTDDGSDNSCMIIVADISHQSDTIQICTAQAMSVGSSDPVYYSDTGDQYLKNVVTVENIDVPVNTDFDHKPEDSTGIFVDRLEIWLPCISSPTVTRQLLEDVAKKRSRAEQVVAQKVFTRQGQGVSSGAATALTPSGHLMSEMTLLEAAACDQLKSLRVAVSEDEKYKTEITYLKSAMTEAREKLEDAPVTVDTVEALKQQITEHNNLTAQIKQDQIKLNKLNEKRRHIALDIAQCSLGIFPKPHSANVANLTDRNQHTSTDDKSQHASDTSTLHVSGRLINDLPLSSGPSYTAVLPEELQYTLPVTMKPLEYEMPAFRCASSLVVEGPHKMLPSRTKCTLELSQSDDILSDMTSITKSFNTTCPYHSTNSAMVMVETVEISASLPESKTCVAPVSSSVAIKAGLHSSLSFSSAATSKDMTNSYNSLKDATSMSTTYTFNTTPSSNNTLVPEKLKSVADCNSRWRPENVCRTNILHLTDSIDSENSHHSIGTTSVKLDPSKSLVYKPPFSASHTTGMSQSLATLSKKRGNVSSSSLSTLQAQLTLLGSPHIRAESITSTSRPTTLDDTMTISSSTQKLSSVESKGDPWISLQLFPSVETSILLDWKAPLATTAQNAFHSARLLDNPKVCMSVPSHTCFSSTSSLLSHNPQNSSTETLTTSHMTSPSPFRKIFKETESSTACVPSLKYETGRNYDFLFSKVTPAQSILYPESSVTLNTAVQSTSSDQGVDFSNTSRFSVLLPFGNPRTSSTTENKCIQERSDKALSSIKPALGGLVQPNFGPDGVAAGDVAANHAKSAVYDHSRENWKLVQFKERELNSVLQIQESYQQSVRDLTVKMEKANIQLARNLVSMTTPLETQIKEHKETLTDIRSVLGDISQVRDLGKHLLISPDSVAHKTIEATLTMLTDRHNNLVIMANNKGKQIKIAKQCKEMQILAKMAYQKQLQDLQNWLEEKKINQESFTLLPAATTSLHLQLDENKELQDEINRYLQQIPDLFVQCDSLSENESLASAEKWRKELTDLQGDLEQLKLTAAEKRKQLLTAIKETEERRREIVDVDVSVQRFKKWIYDTKEITLASSVRTESAGKQIGISEELAAEIKDHRQLVSQIYDQKWQMTPSSSHVLDSETEIRESWERLHRILTEKKECLEIILITGEPRELVQASVNALAKQADSVRQFENVKKMLANVSDDWKQLQPEEKQLSFDAVLTFQKQYRSALQDVYSWLNLAQQQLFLVPVTMEGQINQLENLQRQIRSLHGDVVIINKQGEAVAASTDLANQDIIELCLINLNEIVKLLEDISHSQLEYLHQIERQQKQFQDEVVALQKLMEDTQKVVLTPTSAQSLDQLLSDDQKLDSWLKKCEAQFDKLKDKESNISHSYMEVIFSSELAKVQSTYIELHRRAMEKKATVQNLVSAQDHYQKMLIECAVFLDTACDKLKSDSIEARDISHLKQQMAFHKDFFGDLEEHKAMLHLLANQCDSVARAKFEQQHSSLSSSTLVLVDRASLHGQRIDHLIHQWTELSEKCNRLEKVLLDIESQMPQATVAGDSLTSIQDKCSIYKHLLSELVEERNTLFEVVEEGKQILHSINCPALETTITDLADKWILINSDIDNQLKRSETLGKQLSVFETEAAMLSSFIASAKLKLSSLTQNSPQDLQNVGAIRNRVEEILELQKGMESHSLLKDKVFAAGSQLLLNKICDVRSISNRLRGYEEGWLQLEDGISKTQEYLHKHKAQLDIIPSHQVLNELSALIEKISKSLQLDATKRTNTVAEIEIVVKNYKEYKLELTSKHMMLEYVNRNVITQHAGETSVPDEKLEFAEKIAELNKGFKKVVTDVSDRLNALEDVQNKWEEYEKGFKRLHDWLCVQEDKIQHYKKIGHEVGVKHMLRELKTTQQQLQTRQADLVSIRTLGSDLIEIGHESPGCQESVINSISTLDQSFDRVEERTNQLENTLTVMLGQWNNYHMHLASLDKIRTQIEYALNQYSLIGGDTDALRSQLMKLKDLQSDLNTSSTNLESLSVLARQLKLVCEPTVQVDIQKTVTNVQTKWDQLSVDLAARCHQFEQCLDQWQDYENQYSRMCDWLDFGEAHCADLINISDDTNKRLDSLSKCKKLQRDLDNMQTQISELYRASDDLTKNMSQSAISILTSCQSVIEQRMFTLRHNMSRHIATLNDNMAIQGTFNEAFEAVKYFLNCAAGTLALHDPTNAAKEEALQSRLDELKQLFLLFSANSAKLDAVNDLGYRTALSELSANRLRELNHDWQRQYKDAGDRTRILQSNLLLHQDFTSKCQMWMTFLTQMEQDLATEVKGNLDGLLDQLQICDQCESEMCSREQVLQAIISDGEMMTVVGEEDKNIHQKLHILSEQWQSVSRRARQRKDIIKKLTCQWQQFNVLCQQQRDWLQDKEEVIKTFEFDNRSLMVIMNLREKVQTIKHEFKLQETTYQKICDLGNILLQHADKRAAEIIKDTLSDFHLRWDKALTTLDRCQSQLDGINRQWLECEENIEGILEWLRNIHRRLHTDIPSEFDALQTDLSRCRDITNDFMNSEDKRLSLIAKEKQLGRLFQTEDMNLLHERIRLLNKHWEELKQQNHLREQKLTEALLRWTNFAEHIRALMDWINSMTIKVGSNKDIHVEDLLARLTNEYILEMEKKELEKNGITEHGRQLMNVSSEIRASDIEQKLLRLEDKWQHLKAIMDSRQRNLQGTLFAVTQLDISMTDLSQWLSIVENKLSKDVLFKDIELKEIQEKLQESQELQLDIEHHSAGVSAVLNLCEVLLHDSDACPTEAELVAVQQTIKTLKQRWQNIWALSSHRMIRIEETWQLWKTFIKDCDRFSDWMTFAEQCVSESDLEVPNLKAAKKTIKKYEDLQHSIHDHLNDLERINRQYRQLARDGHTETDSYLKIRIDELNNRWNALQFRVTKIMSRMRHSASIRRDFEESLVSLVTGLTEMDTQLNSLQYLSDLELQTRITEIRHIEDEVYTLCHRIEYLDQSALFLMQKGDSKEALQVQQEMDDFKAFYKQVLAKVSTFRRQINHMIAAQAEDITTPYSDAGQCFQSAAGPSRELRHTQAMYEIEHRTIKQSLSILQKSVAMTDISGPSPTRISLSPSRYSSSPILSAESTFHRSRSPFLELRETPTRYVSSSRLSPFSVRKSLLESARDVTDGLEQDTAHFERSAKIDVLLEQLGESLSDCDGKMTKLEAAMGPHGSTEQIMHWLLECEVTVDQTQRLEQLLKTESGLNNIKSVDEQVIIMLQRWENLQRRAKEQKCVISQEKYDIVNFGCDIEDMIAWLSEAEALQSTHETLPSDIVQLNVVVRQFKDFQIQMKFKKATVLSINQRSEKYFQTKTAETRQLKDKLNEMNSRWHLILAKANIIQKNLQVSLIQCQEFHHTIHDYQLGLENIETRVHHCEPINLNADDSSLRKKYIRLVELSDELQRYQTRVMSLKETADLFQVSSESPEMLSAKNKMYAVHSSMQELMHLTSSYISDLKNRLQMPPNRGTIPSSRSSDWSEDRSSGLGTKHLSASPTSLHAGSSFLETRDRTPYIAAQPLLSEVMTPMLRSTTQEKDNLNTEHEMPMTASQQTKPQGCSVLLMRVIRAALPIHLLFLLLFLLFCLIPVCEEDEYHCMFSNSLRHSISPMLRYTDGAPPT